ncbi:MAG: putative Ig domain-containing protein [Candidatus Sulfotelmatobacter sp.]
MSILSKAEVGIPYAGWLTATGGATPYHWSLADGTLPSGIQLQASSGNIAGMPTLTGSFPFIAKVTDSSGQSATQVFTLTVSPMLSITDTALADADAGTPYAGWLVATGGITPYQWSLASETLPFGFQLQASSGSITGMTTLAGTFPFTAKVTDSSGQKATRAFTLTVFPTLSITDTALVEGDTGAHYVGWLTATGGALPYQWSLVSGTLPSGIQLQASDGSITGMTTLAGSFPFIARVTDSSRQNATQAFTLTFSPTLSITQTTLAEADVGTHYAGLLAATGGIAPYQWSLAGGSLPSGIQLQASNGNITGMATHSGTYPFTAQVTDSSGQNAIQTFTLTVAPTLSITDTTLVKADNGAPYVSRLTATGGITPYEWSFASGTLPSGIQLQASNGSITGMTTLAGTFPFIAKVTDSSGKNATQAFTITVCGPPLYACSSVSSAVVQTPNAPPISTPSSTGTTCTAGAANGRGNGCYNSIGYDTSLNPSGIDPMLRVSDGTMLSGHSPSSTASGGDNDEGWSCTGRTDTSTECQKATIYFLSASYGGCPFVEAIEIIAGLPTVVGPFPSSAAYHPTPCGALTFSHQDPSVAFMQGASSGDPVIYQITYSWDGVIGDSPTFSQTAFYDFGASCSVLPNGADFNEQWSGPLSQDVGDQVFAVSLSSVVGASQSSERTVSVTKGSTDFTVSGFTMLMDGSLVNAAIRIGNPLVTYTIASLTSKISGTLLSNYAGVTNGATPVEIPGGQGTGIYVAAVNTSTNSCAVYNTYAGNVAATGSWTGGAIDSGCHGMYLHDGFLMRDGIYGQWSGASTGVSCGSTSNFWETGTTHAVSCTGTVAGGSALCGGHNAFGYHDEVAISNPNFFQFAPENASSGTPMSSFGAITGNCEDHFSWRNATFGDKEPVIGSSSNNNYSASSTTSSWTYPGQNENYAPLQNRTLKRFGHNFILGMGNSAGCGTTNAGPFDDYFNGGEAIGTVSQDGRLWVFSSSMLGQIGLDVDGNTRQDDFVVKLQ